MSSQTPSWSSGSRFAVGEGRKLREGGRKREGVASPTSFLQKLFNDCLAVIVAATYYTVVIDLILQLVCSSVCRHHVDWLHFLTVPEI